MIQGTDLASLDFFERAERLNIPLDGQRTCLVFELPSADMKPAFIKNLKAFNRERFVRQYFFKRGRSYSGRRPTKAGLISFQLGTAGSANGNSQRRAWRAG
ncbi:hypothetical protein PO124_32570 [Bacillus licheniformis]|nr:hypothetical protein [Bacillus licheniformis]